MLKASRLPPLLLAAPAVLLAAALLLPFRGKAFTIDDTLFLLQAENLIRDPLHPTAFDVVWKEVPERMSTIMPSGPVMAYLLLPCMLRGGVEWAAHGVQLLALALAILATVMLGLRLGLSRFAAGAAGLILGTMPVVLGMTATAMPDIPAMALGVFGLERLAAYGAERRWHQLLFGILGLGLALLARPHLIVLLPLSLFVLAPAILRPAPGPAAPLRKLVDMLFHTFTRSAWIPALALFLSIAVQHVLADPRRGGGGMASSISTFAGLRAAAPNAVAFFGHLALSLPLGLTWAYLRRDALRAGVRGILGCSVGAAVVLLIFHPINLWIAPLCGLSAWAVFDVFHDAWTRRDYRQLFLGLWLIAAAPVLIYIHLPPKYHLAGAPALALLLGQRIANIPAGARRAALLFCVLSVGAGLGVLIISADARFSGLSRKAAAQLIAPRVHAGQNVWFAGHWGFQFYAQRAGAHPLTRSAPLPQPGDVIVSSRLSEGQILQSFPHKHLITSLVDDAPGGRSMNPAAGAGFFSNGYGFLPWTYTTTAAVDGFDVWIAE